MSGDRALVTLVRRLPGPPHFSRSDEHSMKTKPEQTAGNLTPNPFPRGKGYNRGKEITQMNGSPLLNRANVFEAGLFSWGIPEETARELTKNHSELSYSSGKLIFSQGSPADIVLWVVKGVVREVCPNPNGTQTLVRLATVGDILGLADRLNDKGQWERRFEAWAASECVLGIVTRDHVRNLLKNMKPEELLTLSERMNSAAAEWVQYYATFLGLSYRERIGMVMAELGRKFGVPDSDGILLTFEPTHSDLAEMIGSSRPVVGRVLSEMIEDGEIGRRERKYILLSGGAIEAAVKEVPRIQNSHVLPSIHPAAASRQRIPLGRQHRWGRQS
jgi:CRP/FNR family cyclic AMP-dependent transcriptional regulator